MDDDADIRKGFSRMISHLGYSPTVFESGTSFVNALAKGKLSFDLVLMDYNMPGMNGIEASQMTHRYLPDVKIILITAFDFAESETLANGLLYLRKPVSMSALSKILERVIEVPALLRRTD